MKYLGVIRRDGALGARSMAGVLELECYQQHGGMVIASGEVEAQSAAIAQFKPREKLDFVTDDGHRISLTLSDPRHLPTGDFAQITATGDLPSMKDGALDWH